MAVPDDGIAVIGVAAKVPGARDVEEYWLNLVRGRESVTVRGDEQPDAGCFDAEFFDAEFFGMTPRQAQACDPRLRLFRGPAGLLSFSARRTVLPFQLRGVCDVVGHNCIIIGADLAAPCRGPAGFACGPVLIKGPLPTATPSLSVLRLIGS